MSLEVANEGIADFLASRFLRDAVAKAEKFAYAGSIEGEFALARQAGGPSYRALARCTPVKRTSGLPLWMRAEKPISRVVLRTTEQARRPILQGRRPHAHSSASGLPFTSSRG